MENIYDIIAWGRVITQGKEYILLSPKPYHSEMIDGNVVRSLWQVENSLKWEVADKEDRKLMNLDAHFQDNAAGDFDYVYNRSIIIFGSDALIEFYQDPKTIKVQYVIPSDNEQN
jgi:hypothetical protein